MLTRTLRYTIASFAISSMVTGTLLAQTAPTATAAKSTSMSATKYDPKRDPAADLSEALAQAKREGKNILLKVGGEWCPWCHIMVKFFDEHDALDRARVAGFVTLKVNYSKENKNENFLSKYPKIAGYPHLIVLDKDGKLLVSQDTEPLESGKSYNLKAMTDFVAKWSPKK